MVFSSGGEVDYFSQVCQCSVREAECSSGKVESKGVEVRVVDGTVARPIFMWETRVFVLSNKHHHDLLCANIVKGKY